MFKSTVFIATFFLFSSCAIHGGYVTNSAALGTYNFAYVKKSVQGISYATYVFGIGGLKKEALAEEARKDLLENYQLQDNQALINITVSYKRTLVLPFFWRNKCTVSASVVQFNPPGEK
jgi:hypothetical protein